MQENQQYHQQQYQQEKSYVGSSVIVFLLYLLCYVPGLIFNIMWLSEADEWRKKNGSKPSGYGCLLIMFLVGILPLIFFIMAITAASSSSPPPSTGGNASGTVVTPTPAVSPRSTEPLSTPVTQATPVTRWQVIDSVTDMGDTVKGRYIISSNSVSAAFPYHNPFMAVLYIRSHSDVGDQIYVSLIGDSPLPPSLHCGEYTGVACTTRIRIDDNAPLRVGFSEGASGESIFFDDKDQLFVMMRDANKIIIEYPFFGGEVGTFVFDTWE